MGQYFKICCLDRAQYLHPHKLGDGLKLWEFCGSGYGTMYALALLLREPIYGTGDPPPDPIHGSWAGQRIVVAGDYADSGTFLPPDADKSDVNLYIHAEDNFTDVSDDVIAAACRSAEMRKALIERTKWRFDRGPSDERLPCFASGYKHAKCAIKRSRKPQTHLVVNLTKQVRMDPMFFGEQPTFMAFANGNGGIMLALGMLLADGNGRGGGDFDKNVGAGTWAGDSIKIVGSLSPDYAEAFAMPDVSNDVIVSLCADGYYASDCFGPIAVARDKLGVPFPAQLLANVAALALGARTGSEG
jgi:hypothetical protein